MQEIILQVYPRGVNPIVQVSQYDKGRNLLLKLYEGSTAYNIPEGCNVLFEGQKPDGTVFSYQAAYDDNLVTLSLEQQVTLVAGRVTCELRILNGDSVNIGTINFTMYVEASPVDSDDDISETEIPALIDLGQQYAERAETAAEYAESYAETCETAAETAQEVLDSIPEEYTTLSNQVSYNTEDITEINEVVAVKEVADITDDITLSEGYYYLYGSIGMLVDDMLTEDSNSVYIATPLDVSDYRGKIMRIIVTNTYTDSARSFGFCDSNNAIVSRYKENNVDWKSNDGHYEIDIDIDADYFYFSCRSTTVPVGFIIYEKGEIPDARIGTDGTVYETLGIAIRTQLNAKANLSDFEILENEVDALNTQVMEQEIADITSGLTLTSGYYYWSGSIGSTLATVANASSEYIATPADVSAYRGKKLKIVVESVPTASARCIGFCDSNNVIVSVNTESHLEWSLNAEGYYETYLDIDADYFFFSCKSDTNPVSFSVIDDPEIYAVIDSKITAAINETTDFCFVSNDDSASDTNEGTLDAPFATVDYALLKGFKKIYINGSGLYEQTVNLTLGGSSVEISKYNGTDKVIFVNPNRIIISENETLVDGTTKVYMASLNASLDDNLLWIYQDGINDPTTLIDDDDRHPLQRGLYYRCDDTKIERCESESVYAATNEIENSDDYLWYYDSDNSVIYYSRPSAISADNPIVIPTSQNFITDRYPYQEFIARGIDVKYMTFYVGILNHALLEDCKTSNVYGGGCFDYTRTLNVEFIRCEAQHCQISSNGDGFNGHALSSGETFSKQVCASLIDCWSHDNNDDGYSDHERSETMIMGGLYEYNKKGGVTPSYGSHCTCYNVVSQHNYNGFYYTGAATEAEGGYYGQLICNSCLSRNNTGQGSSAGYKTDGGNKVECINCKSIGNTYGFYTPSATGDIRLIDCGTLNNGTVKYGNVTSQNTTIVE